MTLCEDDEQEQDPTTQLWVYYYLANHYLFTGEYQKGFEFIDKAIAHTPTVVELYTLKAKLFKHGGNKEKAYYFYNEARKLDTADRFLNARTARYQI
jgi:peptide alpha-N-acetyltransferase